MYECPHCNAKSIGFFVKWWSGSASPATCRLCGGLSYVTTSEATRTGVVAQVLVFAGLAVVLVTGAIWASGLSAVASLAYYIFAWHRADLIPTSRAQVAAGRRYAWGMVALFLVLLGITGFVSSAKAANPSVELTNCSKLQSAAHLER